MTTPEMQVVADLAAIERSSAHIDRVVVDQSLRFVEARRLGAALAASVADYLSSDKPDWAECHKRAMSDALDEYRTSESGNFLPSVKFGIYRGD